ncbi:sarcosine dehydrogenase, mitochondrial, partial [Nephila pilipes]
MYIYKIELCSKNVVYICFCAGFGFYVAAGGAAAQQSLTHISQVIQNEKFRVSISDVTEKVGLLSIQGPKSRDLLQSLTDADLSNENFPFSTSKIISFAGHQVLAIRLSFVGELGWELHIPYESCVPIYKALMQKGKNYGILNAGYRAIDSLSLEK